MYKSLDLVMLPQKGKAAVHTTYGEMKDSSEFHSLKESHIEGGLIIPYHLYIVSDEEIQDGDLVIPNGLYRSVWEYRTPPCPMPYWGGERSGCKKIIATTDKSIKLLSTALIPKSFIEYFVKEHGKGSIITKVEVEYKQWSVFTVGQTGHETPTETRLVVNQDSTINIRQVQTKTSWTREEVEKLLLLCCGEVSCEDGSLLGKGPADLVEWIEQNLK